MALRLTDGDYVKNENGALTVEYIEELLQNALVALSTRRGRFYPNKSFGSYIKGNAEQPLCEYAFAFASQALDGIDGVYVKSAAEAENGLKINLIINSQEREVTVRLENNL